MGGWPNTDCNSLANWDKAEPCKPVNCKLCQTNDVTDRPRLGNQLRLSSAVDDRVLVRSAVRDPKAPCSELRQQ